MKLQNLSTVPSISTAHKNSAVLKKVLIAKGEVPGLVQFAQATFPPNSAIETHVHESMSEIYFIEQGQGEIIISNTPYTLTSGVCITVDPGEYHAVKNTGTTNLVITLLSLA